MRTADDVKAFFEDDLGNKQSLDFYPGSRRKISDAPRVAAAQQGAATKDMKPRLYTVNGVQVEFFTIGQLAQALGRQAVTIRKWEHEGILPVTGYWVSSEDKRGRKRLYTRAQVEGIVRIAIEEKIFETYRTPIKKTRFTERVIALFQQLPIPGT